MPARQTPDVTLEIVISYPYLGHGICRNPRVARAVRKDAAQRYRLRYLDWVSAKRAQVRRLSGRRISRLDALRDLFNGNAWMPPGLEPAGQAGSRIRHIMPPIDSPHIHPA